MELTFITALLCSVGLFLLGYIIGCAVRVKTQTTFYTYGMDAGIKAYESHLKALGTQTLGEMDDNNKDNDDIKMGFDLSKDKGQ